MRSLLVAAVAAIAALCLATAAWAADAAATVVDLKPLLDTVVWPLVGALASVLATWLAARLAGVLKLERNDKLAQLLESAIQNGVALAKDRLAGVSLSVDVKSAVAKQAADYVMAHVPDALKWLKIDADSLREKIEARLAKSEQTPPPAVVVAPIAPVTPS